MTGLSFRVCLGPEEFEQWYEDRRDLLVLLPSHATRVSRSPRFRLCSPEIRKKKKSRLFAAARDILVNSEISLAVFIPNTPRNRAISYTNSKLKQHEIPNIQVRECINHRTSIRNLSVVQTKRQTETLLSESFIC